MVLWINHLPCKPGVVGSIPGFFKQMTMFVNGGEIFETIDPDKDIFLPINNTLLI